MNKSKWVLRMCNLADHWSQYSTCVRRQVGAVVFDPVSFAVYGMGYNDTVIGAADCGEGGCTECENDSGVSTTDLINCACVHAEMNALLLARRDLRGAWIAIATQKNGRRSMKELCANCRKHLIQAGIVVWCQSATGQAATVRRISDNEPVVWD